MTEKVRLSTIHSLTFPEDRVRMITRIAVYSTLSRNHPVAMVRLGGPIDLAGLHLIWGSEHRAVRPVIEAADVVVVQRDFPRRWDVCQQVVEQARTFKRPVLFEMDDLIWDLPKDHLARRNQHYTDALVPMLLAAMEADAITVSTSRLHEQICSVNSNIWVLPNYLNDGLWSFRSPAPPEQARAPIVVGYFGSLAGHEHDLRMVLPALERLLQSYPKEIILKFWGSRPPPELLRSRNVVYIPLAIENYAQYASFCQSQKCDILIAPLQPTVFNQCKSPIKFLEYAAMGVPAVYSRVAPYSEVVEHGKDGLLADGPDEWYDRLVDLIEKPNLRYEMSVSAQEKVRQGWLLSNHAHEWKEIYERLASGHVSQSKPPVCVAAHIVTAIGIQVVEAQQEKGRSHQWLAPRASRREQVLDRALRIWRLWKREGLRVLLHRGAVKLAPWLFR